MVQGLGLLLFLHPKEGGEDGSLCWMLLRWLCCGWLVERHGSPSDEEGGGKLALRVSCLASSVGGLAFVTFLGMGQGEDKVGAWLDKQLDVIWERFGQTLCGEGENIFSSCLPKHFPGLAWC